MQGESDALVYICRYRQADVRVRVRVCVSGQYIYFVEAVFSLPFANYSTLYSLVTMSVRTKEQRQLPPV